MSDRQPRTRMRPFAALHPWSEAKAAAMELATPVEASESIDLARAAGRLVACDAAASVDVPSADRAAMDGYAVRSQDVATGGPLRLRGRLAAGEAPTTSVNRGECIEIATGAPIPPGADAVIPVERTEIADRGIRCLHEVLCGEHIALRASDLRAGRPVAKAGDRLTASLLAACAAGGVTRVEVYRRPRVLVAPTGNEVVQLGQPLPPGRVYDSNATGLLALARAAGADAEHAGIVIDEIEALLEVLRGPRHDLVVTIGGTSVGRRDLVSEAVAQSGQILLHGVAVRPGKPLLIGEAPAGPVLGLPGFPTTCMMLGYSLLDPMLRRMARQPGRSTLSAELAESVESPGGKAQLLPVALVGGRAVPTFTFSSAVSSMARAAGWIEIAPAVRHVDAGTAVEIQLF